VSRVGAVGRNHASVGQEFARIVEADHAVAQQAPPLLRVGRDDAGGVAVSVVRRRARRLVWTHRTTFGDSAKIPYALPLRAVVDRLGVRRVSPTDWVASPRFFVPSGRAPSVCPRSKYRSNARRRVDGPERIARSGQAERLLNAVVHNSTAVTHASWVCRRFLAVLVLT